LKKGDCVHVETREGIFERGVVAEAQDPSSSSTTVQITFQRPATNGPFFSPTRESRQKIYFAPVTEAHERSSIHPHVVITVPIMAISDDKKHDTYFVQGFFLNFLFGEEGWFRTQTKYPGLWEGLKKIVSTVTARQVISSSDLCYISYWSCR
jgi:hypothetical protein